MAVPYRRITPTAFARQRKTVQMLGSTSAVIQALPDGAVMLIGTWPHNRENVALVMAALGRAPDALKLMPVSGGPNILWELPPETVVGVDTDAFAGAHFQLYEDMRSVLQKRFQQVHWG